MVLQYKNYSQFTEWTKNQTLQQIEKKNSLLQGIKEYNQIKRTKNGFECILLLLLSHVHIGWGATSGRNQQCHYHQDGNNQLQPPQNYNTTTKLPPSSEKPKSKKRNRQRRPKPIPAETPCTQNQSKPNHKINQNLTMVSIIQPKPKRNKRNLNSHNLTNQKSQGRGSKWHLSFTWLYNIHTLWANSNTLWLISNIESSLPGNTKQHNNPNFATLPKSLYFSRALNN